MTDDGPIGRRGVEPTAAARGPAVLLGIGLGAFLDGIVLHQILQWHHLLTATGDHPPTTVAGLEANTVADGLFHALAWLAVAGGLWWSVRAARAGRPVTSGRALLGLLLVGWGAFNLVEGVVDHHVLRVHHVRDDVADPLPWDLGFLAFGVALVATGLALARGARHPGVPSARDGVSDQHVVTGAVPARTAPTGSERAGPAGGGQSRHPGGAG